MTHRSLHFPSPVVAHKNLSMHLLRLSGLLVASLLLLTGCSTARLSDAPPDRSLVYAYIDFSEIEMLTTWADIKQVSPETDKPFMSMGYMRNPNEHGRYTSIIFRDDLEKGSYQIVTVGGQQTLFMRHAKMKLDFGEMGKNITAIRIDKPGIYFLGAYRYHPITSTWIGRGSFDLEPIQSPNQTELLKALYEVMGKGTSWESRILTKLQQSNPQ